MDITSSFSNFPIPFRYRDGTHELNSYTVKKILQIYPYSTIQLMRENELRIHDFTGRILLNAEQLKVEVSKFLRTTFDVNDKYYLFQMVTFFKEGDTEIYAPLRVAQKCSAKILQVMYKAFVYLSMCVLS